MSGWTKYKSQRPEKAGDYVVEIETKEQLEAYWSPMWNSFKIGDQLLWGVVKWKEKA